MDDSTKIERNRAAGKPPRAGMGRPKGCSNKKTQAAKDAIADAALALGGTKRLVEWAKSDPNNERVFWGTIYPKLLPLQVGGDAGNPIEHMVVAWASES